LEQNPCAQTDEILLRNWSMSVGNMHLCLKVIMWTKLMK